MVHSQRKLFEISDDIAYFDCANVDRKLSKIIKYKHEEN